MAEAQAAAHTEALIGGQAVALAMVLADTMFACIVWLVARAKVNMVICRNIFVAKKRVVR
jgi:hypothetical protein